jgi:hypothetical protein
VAVLLLVLDVSKLVVDCVEVLETKVPGGLGVQVKEEEDEMGKEEEEGEEEEEEEKEEE